MSRRERHMLDDLFGNDQLGQRSAPRADSDGWAAGRAEQKRKRDEKKKIAKQQQLKEEAAKRREAKKAGGRKRGLF